jgi:hypothetical protein
LRCLYRFAQARPDQGASWWEGSGDEQSGDNRSRLCALQLDRHFHQAASRVQIKFDTTLMVGRATLGMCLGGEHDHVGFAIAFHRARWDDGGC